MNAFQTVFTIPLPFVFFLGWRSLILLTSWLRINAFGGNPCLAPRKMSPFFLSLILVFLFFILKGISCLKRSYAQRIMLEIYFQFMLWFFVLASQLLDRILMLKVICLIIEFSSFSFSSFFLIYYYCLTMKCALIICFIYFFS